jgi:CMP-N,N'-diacetyllegionaminic acid synthase
MYKHVCIIPARSGSKTIKDKNLLKLNSRTLVNIAHRVALESKVFSKIVITSDYLLNQLQLDAKMGDMGTEFVYVKRPGSLAQDDTEMIDVIRHTLDDIGGTEKWIWIMQPTSPFRTVEDIHKIKDLLDSKQYRSVISWKPQKEYIDRTATWKNERAYRISQNNFHNKQEIQPQVHRSGNFYVLDRDAITKYGGMWKNFSFMVEPSYAYIMGGVNPEKMTTEEFLKSRMLGTNIDDLSDFNQAKDFIRRGDFRL